MDQIQTSPIRGTEDARGPFFSPDGESVGFWSEGQLKRVSIHGGAPIVLCEVQNPLGAEWEADDTIVFGQQEGGLMRVSASGGAPELLVALAATGRQGDSPQMLPGGTEVLFHLGDNANWDNAQIVVHSLETGERKVVIEGGRAARYIPTGHLVYVLDGTLLVVPFDVDTLAVTGAPVPIIENVMLASSGVSGAAQYDVSQTGSLVYVTGPHGDPERTLVWVDRDGNEEALAVDPKPYSIPRIAPGGDRLAVAIQGEERDLWIWDFRLESFTRFAFDTGLDQNPVWSPDGETLVFESHRNGEGNIYIKPARGSGEAVNLLESPYHQRPLSMAPDGSSVLIEEGLGHRSLSLLPLAGASAPQPLLHSDFDETNAESSPDGRWIAYQSNESGRDEVYVRPFPDVESDRWRVSKDGGTHPLWAPNGRELFYLGPDGRLMVVPLETSGERFAPGIPERALDRAYFQFNSARSRDYDISRDSKRFLMIKEDENDETPPTEIILVQNWFQELERLVPTQ